MTPAELSRTVLRAVRRAVAADELRVPVLPETAGVRRSPRAGCGDYVTNVALRLAKPAGQPPRRVAEILRRELSGVPGIARVDIAEPGFLNITLQGDSHGDTLRAIREQGPRYGHGHGQGSAGLPAAVTRGGGRAGLVADVAGRLLRASGGAPPAPAVVAVRPVHEPLDRLYARLGPDATRWALLRPPAEDTPKPDAAALLAQREANPLFRVQYAHARTRALLRNAHDLGVDAQIDAQVDIPNDTRGDGFRHPAETGLIAVLADFPRVVLGAARHRAPDRVARYLEQTADAFFRFHDACPVLPRGDEKPEAVHRARLALADATGTVLANGLTLLGISAPEHL